MKIDISIIIPTKNGQSTIEAVLSAIQNQNTKYKFEIIIIDSGSSDETLPIVNQFNTIVHSILPEEFSHSKTRNLGASLSEADQYLVYLNQDAIPTDEFWLDNLVKSIEFESDIKAACAMELDRRKRFYNVSGVAAYLFRNSSVNGLYVIEPNLIEHNKDIKGEQLRQLFPFTTVCAIFNKDHFMRFPFDERVIWGEDLYWAVTNSSRGFKSACSSFAKVFHHHDYSQEEFRQIMVHTARIYRELFGFDLDISALGSEDYYTEGCMSCIAMKNSISWRITKPLRAVYDLLRRR